MNANIKLIARRIKALREISEKSVDELAKACKVSKSQYQIYESGTAVIPSNFLNKVARTFNVEPSALLSNIAEASLQPYTVIRCGKAPKIHRRKEYNYKDLAWNNMIKKAETFVVSIEPKPAKSPVRYYNHPGQEFNYILEGTLKILLDGYEVTLRKGDAIFFNSGLDHRMVALGGKKAKLLAVII